MNLRQIEIFNAVYEMGSISEAAKVLGIAQPTASKILKHAEDGLGFLLFRRVRGRLVATSEANILYKETEGIYKRIARLKQTAENLKNPEDGKIRIVSVAALSIEILPRLIQDFRAKHKSAQFIYQTEHFSSMMKTLFDYDKEIGFALNPPKIDGVKEVVIGEGELVCIYGSGEFDDYPDRLKLPELQSHDYVSIEDSGPLSDLLENRMDKDGLSFQSSLIAQTYFVARNMVALGSGIAIVDDVTARSNRPENVKYKGFNPPIKYQIKALFLSERKLSPAAERFLEFVKRGFK
ncbi:LysR family transcriptional regulator [Pseudemcibacter aquimaris]|uniref:LysR family transcriptional regulator n=1 Tax=Pseudemcibacter aquimaris TaxID=2857064 RepID=UPI002012851F|nr:LysR family transcriptional regulator [Pseudemcibacter aquimaris]MCC3862578.1 LysR family transcriptional regulator [Pseudemcibacter aquimaris]WDU57904.1 LysR family transcriptional regulator [Pseudemcibacter aquimaris]